jgi:hypothetical protein
MNRDLQNIKSVIDLSIKAGLFNNGETVVQIMNSFGYIRIAVELFEKGKPVPDNNSERRMPEKSNYLSQGEPDQVQVDAQTKL